jgi:hypothetical protein
MTGIERIAAERKRQIEEEGWTAKHDSQWENGELVDVAICYSMSEEERERRPNPLASEFGIYWPWDGSEWWKPTPYNRIRELEKAGALIAAEIDRLQRLGDREEAAP